MTGFTQKYTIVQLLEPVAEGTIYKPADWPLHTTLADIFAIDWDEETLLQNCAQEFKKLTTISTTASSDEWFGKDKNIQVTLLEKNTAITELHFALVTFLEKGNVQFNTPEFVRDGFKPHVTMQKDNHLNKGDKVVINALTIIDMFPNDDPYLRKILKTIPLAPQEV
jgi:2'-5' RNA ligase